MRIQRSVLLVVVAVLALSLAACDAISSAIDTTAPESGATTQAPATTAAPPATEAPPATDTPAGDEESGFGSLLPFLGLFLLGFLLIGILIGRSRKKKAATPPPVPVTEKMGFKDYARDGYSESRWMLDALSDELAIWRGNALFDGSTGPEDSAGTALASTWAQLDDRMNRAVDQLYRAEASAPDQNTSQLVRTTVDALHATRSAVDARAQARFNTRQTEDQFAMAEAGERERLASSNLAQASQGLNDALLALSAVV